MAWSQSTEKPQGEQVQLSVPLFLSFFKMTSVCAGHSEWP